MDADIRALRGEQLHEALEREHLAYLRKHNSAFLMSTTVTVLLAGGVTAVLVTYLAAHGVTVRALLMGLLVMTLTGSGYMAWLRERRRNNRLHRECQQMIKSTLERVEANISAPVSNESTPR